MNPPIEEARELFAAGERDRVAFRILRRDAESPLEIVLFHAQQAIEKYLKAVLVSHGVMFRRTHDLLELRDLVEGAGIAVPVERPLLARLVPYAVDFRYLGVGAPEVSPEEAEHAIGTLRDWTEQQLTLTP
jgi:HEPN domain-containing protein